METDKVNLERVTEFSAEEVDQLEHLLKQMARTRFEIPAQQVQILRDDTRSSILVLKKDEIIIGMGTLVEMQMLTGKRSRLEQMIIDEPERGHGYGRKLLNYVIEYSKKQGCIDLRFTSGKDRSESHNLYTSAGFNFAEKVGYDMNF